MGKDRKEPTITTSIGARERRRQSCIPSSDSRYLLAKRARFTAATAKSEPYSTAASAICQALNCRNQLKRAPSTNQTPPAAIR